MKSTKNIRDMSVSTGDGKDVRDTQQLSGEAKPSAAFKAKNATTQYETSGGNKVGSLGGENTNS